MGNSETEKCKDGGLQDAGRGVDISGVIFGGDL
jgi:hypothetical protein